MSARMSREHAVRIAQTVADRKGWPWLEPVEVAKRRPFPRVWKAYWHVTTSARHGTQSVYVRIDDSSGRVVRVAYSPY